MDDFLTISHVHKKYLIKNNEFEVLSDVNLTVREGEFISIVGISGCGKSTLLKLIVGLESASAGEVLLAGNKVREPSEMCGIVYQEPRLFPWSNVVQNIAFGIPKNFTSEEKKRRIREHINLVGLNDFEYALPKHLSGGMQQRVSIARALVGNPELLLLDEPFGALDALTRIHMQREVLKIWKVEKRTMILVTHDIDEAIFLGDRVIVMTKRPGTIQEIIPVELERPRNRTSDNFQKIRKRIYSRFFEESDLSIEYYL
jgi:sulfonate transport system ATP-binding protein